MDNSAMALRRTGILRHRQARSEFRMPSPSRWGPFTRSWRGDPVKIAKLRAAFETFTHELPTDGTLHVGEFYKVDASGRWRNVNDMPHVWEHMLIYHTSMELYR